MNKLKVFLAVMFTFTAVIRTTEVGQCGTRHHRYNGIKATFDIKNGAGVVVSRSQQCAANWPSLKDAIKEQLNDMQRAADENLVELKELKRLQKEAKELVGAEIGGDR